MHNSISRKVLLLTAPRPTVNETPLHYGDNRPPLGLGYIAANLEKHGHKAKIIDLYHFGGEVVKGNPKVTQEEQFSQLKIDLDKEIKSFAPEFIGMYIHTMSFYTACKLSEELKKKFPNITLVCGGPHPTVLPETIPPEFDHVVIGEGEVSLLEIIEGKIQDRLVHGKRTENIDDLPWPDYDRFIDKPYNWKFGIFENKDLTPVISLNTTRGCPFPCKFCGVFSISGRSYRTTSPENLFTKILELKEKYGLKGVYFREDNFTASSVRLEKVCDMIIDNNLDIKWACESRVKNLSSSQIEKMAQSGCCGLYIGVESGSPRMLEYVKKEETVEDFLEKFPILHDHGIRTYTTWMIGLPTETKEDRILSDELMGKLNPTSHDKFVFIGIPKSPFYDELDKENNYEFKESNGLIYPKGYLSLAQQLYGDDDPRCKYVETIYEDNGVESLFIEI